MYGCRPESWKDLLYVDFSSESTRKDEAKQALLELTRPQDAKALKLEEDIIEPDKAKNT